MEDDARDGRDITVAQFCAYDIGVGGKRNESVRMQGELVGYGGVMVDENWDRGGVGDGGVPVDDRGLVCGAARGGKIARCEDKSEVGAGPEGGFQEGYGLGDGGGGGADDDGIGVWEGAAYGGDEDVALGRGDVDGFPGGAEEDEPCDASLAEVEGVVGERVEVE